MNRAMPWVVCFALLGSGAQVAAQPSLTVYNQHFAVVRETVPLQLEVGRNRVTFSDITAHVEADSVILRDPAGERELQILEQNYRSDPISQALLLSLYEGETIRFLQRDESGADQIVWGKIVRSGYVRHDPMAQARYGQYYSQLQYGFTSDGNQPLIEVDGLLRFGLPGIPLFPELQGDTILKPTMEWVIEANQAGPLEAELGYVTGGMTWEASYNLVAPETEDTLGITAWVTIDNQSGKTFQDARVKLMAGDVQKIDPEMAMYRGGGGGGFGGGARMAPPVTEKTFDEYHLYSLSNATTVRDRETKQVEFVRAEGVKSERVYVYEGAVLDSDIYRNWGPQRVLQEPDYGTQSNPKVWVMREFMNSQDNGLGIPLPKGRTRFYRQDADGQLEFTGEAIIDHTPKGELVRVYTGNAFDLVGERVRTMHNFSSTEPELVEQFEITLRNHKPEPVTVRVVERLYRWINWELSEHTHEFLKKDAQTIEFKVELDPDEEEKLIYRVTYSGPWSGWPPAPAF